MEEKNKYSFFNPNYFVSKKEQIKLEKLIKLSKEEDKNNLLAHNKLKIWQTQNKSEKIYNPQESKYNLKQLIKIFKFSKEELLNEFSNKYIALFTNLLYDKKKKNYAKKRLSLVDFRKKILKNHLNISFEDYIHKEPLSEKYNFSKQNLNNIYLTQIIQKSDNSKFKLKNKKINLFSNIYNKNRNKFTISSRVLIKDLSNNFNFNDKKLKLRLYTESNNNSPKDFSCNNGKSNFKKIKERNNTLNNFRVSNISFTESKNILKNNIKSFNYTSRRDYENEKDYFDRENPIEEFLEGRDKQKYIDYLKKEYNFYTNNKVRDLRNFSKFKKRQLLLYKEKGKIALQIEFPYKKEFFRKFNKLKNKSYSKNSFNYQNKEGKDNNIFRNRNSFPKKYEKMLKTFKFNFE